MLDDRPCSGASMSTGSLLADVLSLPARAYGVERLALSPGEALYREGDVARELYYLERGRLEVRSSSGEQDGLLYAILAGETVGEAQLVGEGRRTTTVVAAEPSEVIRVPLEQLREEGSGRLELPPRLLDLVREGVRRQQLAVGLGSLLGPLGDERLRELERGTEWIRLRRGQALVRQGDTGQDVWVLVSGRLRAVREGSAGLTVLGDIARGESIGEMVFFTGEKRSATVLATRDSELVRFSGEAFDALLRTDHDASRRVTRLVVDRLRRSYAPTPPAQVRTIAVLPASPGVDVTDFARQLTEALGDHGPATRLTAAGVDDALGPGASGLLPGELFEVAVETWLDQQELANRFVVLVVEPEPRGWAQRCVARADLVLLLADAGADPRPGPLERELLRDEKRATAARRTLVLIHDPTTPLPAGTTAWLEPRELDAHHHLRRGDQAGWRRLARFMAGRAVGVVLGGGGARGFAHIGVLQALREAGVPIDLIGGTSMGASMAAQYAMGWDAPEMLRRNRAAWLDLKPHKEYTLPLLSILKGRKAALMGRMLYGDVAIEDLWTPYYCVSTNLTRGEQRVHRRGSLRVAATASASLPAVVTPVVDGGELFVDGAILNNLPVDVMREVGAGVVLAVDVSTDEDLTWLDETFPSPWAVLRDRVLDRAGPAVPTIGEVLLRCTMLGSVTRTADARELSDFYLRPPLEQIGLMEFTALETAAEIGRAYTSEMIETWRGTPLFGTTG
jgi:predicted acylesterase/phospholipase RssA/CRP-like cAMP-binding protein